MSISKVIIDETFGLNRKYRVTLYVIEVVKSKKHPDGIKAKFVLVDAEKGCARLLVDNHEPHGWHIHTELPEVKNVRAKIAISDHNEAMDLFFTETERIIADEKN